MDGGCVTASHSSFGKEKYNVLVLLPLSAKPWIPGRMYAWAMITTPQTPGLCLRICDPQLKAESCFLLAEATDPLAALNSYT